MVNVLTDSLLDDIKVEVFDHVENNFTHLAFGSGTATPVSTQTTMSNETYRVSSTTYSETASVATASFFLGSAVNNGNTIAEIGVFDSTTSGSNEMQTRSTLTTSINKTSDKEVWVDIDIEPEVREN